MKKLIPVLLLSFGVGCVSAADKARIAYQAARLDRAVALINSGATTREQEQNFIRGERREWHALDYSFNGTALPPDMQVVTSAGK